MNITIIMVAMCAMLAVIAVGGGREASTKAHQELVKQCMAQDKMPVLRETIFKSTFMCLEKDKKLEIQEEN